MPVWAPPILPFEGPRVLTVLICGDSLTDEKAGAWKRALFTLESVASGVSKAQRPSLDRGFALRSKEGLASLLKIGPANEYSIRLGFRV